MEQTVLVFCCFIVWISQGCLAQLKADCPRYVSLGKKLSCSCTYPVSNPPPGMQISWPGHSNNYQLEKENVQRTDNGTNFTCEMTASGQTQSVVYTLQVAYGPADVCITGPRPIITNGTDPVSLTCLATEVNPTPSITWTGVNCSNGNQGNGKATCTFTPTPADEGKVVTCTAMNPLVRPNGQTASGNFTLSVNLSAADNCTDITVDIVDSQPEPGIYCELPVFFRTNIFWSITKPASGGKETRIAQCGRCAAYGPACQCGVSDSDYSVTRTSIDQGVSNSTLYFVNNVQNKNGSIIKCSAADNTSCVTMQLNVIEDYTLPQCENGQIDISEAGTRLPITCDGVGPSQSVNWTLTDDSCHVTNLAFCTEFGDCTTNFDVTASRTHDASTLTFLIITGLKDNSTLTCAKKNGPTNASCRIRTFDNDIMKTDRSKLWVVVVPVGLVAVVVVIIIVILAVVVFRRRRGKEDGPPATGSHSENHPADDNTSGDYYLTPVASHSPQVDQLPYDSLRMSEVGLRSEYSDVGHHGNASH